MYTASSWGRGRGHKVFETPMHHLIIRFANLFKMRRFANREHILGEPTWVCGQSNGFENIKGREGKGRDGEGR